MIDLLFTTFNRLEFTKASLRTLVANTNWDLVSRIHLADDGSRDGTWEWLTDEGIDLLPDVPRVIHRRFGGPVAAMNQAVRLSPVREAMLAKVDNDVIVCPGWLDTLADVLERSPELDVLGVEPGFGDPVAPLDVPRSWLPASHVGGVGLFRTRIFRLSRPRANGRYGWTDFQRHHASCGWVTPDLPCFLLDHLPVEPWQSLTLDYVAAGWQREWPVYPEAMADYWSWWSPVEAAA